MDGLIGRHVRLSALPWDDSIIIIIPIYLTMGTGNRSTNKVEDEGTTCPSVLVSSLLCIIRSTEEIKTAPQRSRSVAPLVIPVHATMAYRSLLLLFLYNNIMLRKGNKYLSPIYLRCNRCIHLTLEEMMRALFYSCPWAQVLNCIDG